MKKVLIALDFNPSARKVAEMGYAFAGPLHAEITLVHVIADASYYSMEYSPIMGYDGFNNTSTIPGLVEELKTEARKFLEASARHLGDANIRTEVIEGKTSDAILEYATRQKADLIVMGSHSHSGFEKLLMGDVSASVLKHSEIPMLIVPNKEK